MIGTRTFVSPSVAADLVENAGGRLHVVEIDMPNADVAMAFGSFCGIGAQWVDGRFTESELRAAKESTRAMFPALRKELARRGCGWAIPRYETFAR